MNLKTTILCLSFFLVTSYCPGAHEPWRQEIGSLALAQHQRLGSKSPAQAAVLQQGILQEIAKASDKLNQKEVKINNHLVTPLLCRITDIKGQLISENWIKPSQLMRLLNAGKFDEAEKYAKEYRESVMIPIKNVRIEFSIKLNNKIEPQEAFELTPEQVSSLYFIDVSYKYRHFLTDDGGELDLKNLLAPQE